MSSSPRLETLIPPRRMWDWGPLRSGYCGETSFQLALQSLGVVMSVEVVHRSINCEELLIGSGNDVRAATVLGLGHEVYNESRHKGSKGAQAAFVDDFVASHVARGHLIACGFTDTSYDSGKEYDHIMPIVSHSRSNGGSVGYYDLFFNQRRDMPADDDYISTLPAKPEGSEFDHPIPWSVPKGPIYAIALTGLEGITAGKSTKFLLPLAAHVPYFMEVDSRRMYPWNINCADNKNTCKGKCSRGDHPFETQLREIKGLEKHRQEFVEWFNVNGKDGQFSKIIDPKIDLAANGPVNPMCIIPVSLRVNPFLFSPANLHQGATFVILKFQGVLAQRIFADILGQQPSGHSDDGICNVCVVQDSVAIIDGNIGDFLAKTSVLCTEVAYFVGVEKKFYESVLLTDRRFQKMMNNFEKLQEEEKKVGPVAMMRKYAGYIGVEISIGDNEVEDEEEEEEEEEEEQEGEKIGGMNAKQLRSKFDWFDSDGSGYLDKSECMAVVSSYFQSLRVAKALNIIMNHDANHDGKISFKEFKSILRDIFSDDE